MGGALAAFRHRSPTGLVDLLRPASEHAVFLNNALDSASYPLVPYSNRIANGVLTFKGKQRKARPSFPPHPHKLHGHGYLSEWKAEQADATSALLSFEYSGDDFPSSYRSEQRFSLRADALSVEMTVRNTGSETMPAGLGFHPFFPKTPDMRLEAPLQGVWLMAAHDGIPTDHVPVPQEWDFTTLLEVGGVVLDHCFTGWSTRRAVVEWPSRKLRVNLTGEGPLDFLVIFSPEGGDFVCVEPVTNMNDAFNRFDRGEQNTGTVVLEPGQSLGIKMTLHVERLG
jgi:aldose 1-epimerase